VDKTTLEGLSQDQSSHIVVSFNIYFVDKTTLEGLSQNMGACGTHGKGEKSVQGFGGKARRKETTWKAKT
jgi:hypothetical protein